MLKMLRVGVKLALVLVAVVLVFSSLHGRWNTVRHSLRSQRVSVDVSHSVRLNGSQEIRLDSSLFQDVETSSVDSTQDTSINLHEERKFTDSQIQNDEKMLNRTAEDSSLSDAGLWIPSIGEAPKTEWLKDDGNPRLEKEYDVEGDEIQKEEDDEYDMRESLDTQSDGDNEMIGDSKEESVFTLWGLRKYFPFLTGGVTEENTGVSGNKNETDPGDWGSDDPLYDENIDAEYDADWDDEADREDDTNWRTIKFAYALYNDGEDDKDDEEEMDEREEDHGAGYVYGEDITTYESVDEGDENGTTGVTIIRDMESEKENLTDTSDDGDVAVMGDDETFPTVDYEGNDEGYQEEYDSKENKEDTKSSFFSLFDVGRYFSFGRGKETDEMTSQGDDEKMVGGDTDSDSEYTDTLDNAGHGVTDNKAETDVEDKETSFDYSSNKVEETNTEHVFGVKSSDESREVKDLPDFGKQNLPFSIDGFDKEDHNDYDDDQTIDDKEDKDTTSDVNNYTDYDYGDEDIDGDDYDDDDDDDDIDEYLIDSFGETLDDLVNGLEVKLVSGPVEHNTDSRIFHEGYPHIGEPVHMSMDIEHANKAPSFNDASLLYPKVHDTKILLPLNKPYLPQLRGQEYQQQLSQLRQQTLASGRLTPSILDILLNGDFETSEIEEFLETHAREEFPVGILYTLQQKLHKANGKLGSLTRGDVQLTVHELGGYKLPTQEDGLISVLRPFEHDILSSKKRYEEIMFEPLDGRDSGSDHDQHEAMVLSEGIDDETEEDKLRNTDNEVPGLHKTVTPITTAYYDNPRPLSNAEFARLRTSPYKVNAVTSLRVLDTTDVSMLEKADLSTQPPQQGRSDMPSMMGFPYGGDTQIEVPQVGTVEDSKTWVFHGRRTAQERGKTGESNDVIVCPREVKLAKTYGPVTALVAFPGEGTMWARELLEQLTGIRTDSIYDIMADLRGGRVASVYQMGKKIAIETHAASDKNFDRAVVLVKNPFSLEEKYKIFRPSSVEWQMSFLWNLTYSSWLSSDLPLFVLTLEDLIESPMAELTKLSAFLTEPDVSLSYECAMKIARSPPRFITNIMEIAGIYYHDRRRINQSIDSVMAVSRLRHPEILARLSSYKVYSGL